MSLSSAARGRGCSRSRSLPNPCSTRWNKGNEQSASERVMFFINDLACVLLYFSCLLLKTICKSMYFLNSIVLIIYTNLLYFFGFTSSILLLCKSFHLRHLLRPHALCSGRKLPHSWGSFRDHRNEEEVQRVETNYSKNLSKLNLTVKMCSMKP